MKKFFNYIYFLFILIILIFIYLFTRNNFDFVLETINKISIFDFFLLSISTIITITLNGNKIEILTRYYKLKLKFKEWFGLSVVTTMGNYLAPFGSGMLLRGVYLKKKYGFSYKNFITTLATSYLTSFLLYSFIGIMITIIIYYQYNLFNTIFFLIFLITFLSCLGIMVLSPKIKNKKNKFLNKFEQIINNWKKMKKNYRLLIRLTLNDFFSLLNYSIRIFLAFYILGDKIPFISSVLISLVTLFSLIIGLTPASIGVKEALIAYSTTVIGKSFGLGIAVATIDRIIALIYVFFLGGLFSYILLISLKNKNDL